METTLTKIGNSRGIIIPARLLRSCGLEGKVSLEERDGKIIISKPANPREGWGASFADAHPDNTELLIDDALPNDFDDEDWTW